MSKTVVVTLCDEKYFWKASRTIQDVRSVGRYWGDLVLVTIGFTPAKNFLDFYQIRVKSFPPIDTTLLVNQLKEKPFTSGDGRERTKLAQWNKLYLFHEYFHQWNRVIFFDAGFRIFRSLEHYLNVPWEGHITALDDSHPEGVKRFQTQLEMRARPEKIRELEQLLPGVLGMRYFLNCFWIHDTAIITKETFNDMVSLMNHFPICLTNEMAIMNIYFALKKQWQPLNIKLENGLILMDWSEREGRDWRSYVGLKYPTTISFQPEKDY